MTAISDERLMAFADGALTDAERAEVEAYLLSSEEARARLIAFVETRNLAPLFDDVLDAPVPQHLIDAVRNLPVATAATAATSIDGGNVVSLAARRARLSRPVLTALAASVVAAMVGLAVQRGALQPAGGDMIVAENGTRFAGPQFAGVLANQASGARERHELGGAVTNVKITFSFATRDKEFCRQYTAVPEVGAAQAGVACLAADGRWRIAAHETVAASASGDGGIRPAGRDGMAAIDAIVDRMISGEVLEQDEEAVLIARGWRAAQP